LYNILKFKPQKCWYAVQRFALAVVPQLPTHFIFALVSSWLLIKAFLRFTSNGKNNSVVGAVFSRKMLILVRAAC